MKIISKMRALAGVGAAIVVSSLALTTFMDAGPQLLKVKIVLQRTPASWPMYIAKDAGYYEKHGLDVDLVFAITPAPIAMLISGEAQMANTTLDQAMQVASVDGSFVAIGGFSRKGLFALMVPKGIRSIPDLRGKRIAVGQIGDGPYTYTVKILAKSGLTPRDVEWLPVGNSREAALSSGRAEATLLNAPTYFRLEEAGFHSVANTADYDDIYGAVVHFYRKATLAKYPELPTLLIKSHAEAVRRFYADKEFALKAYMLHDRQDANDIERVFNYLVKTNTFERVPYIPAAAVEYVRGTQYDRGLAERMREYNFRTVIDNTLVDRVAREGVLEDLFGPGIRSEVEGRRSLAFR
jgi:ABC-type nitrate/sulfonate/bicarbonate transport system substrate-binding protein